MIAQAECDFSVNFAPSVQIDDCPVQDLNTNNYVFQWHGTDPEGDPMEYQTQLDTQGWSGWGSATSQNVIGLTSGNHIFRVRVRDATSGQTQTQCNFLVNFGPSISINNKPTQDVNSTSYQFTWTASDDRDSSLTMQYNVEKDGVWQGWQTGISSYNWSALTSGLHTFRVRVRDNGNPQLWAEDVCNFLVNFKPTALMDNCPSGVWPFPDITLQWSGIDDNSPEAGMSYSYKMDSDPWSGWQIGTLSAAYVGLANGDHTFQVRVRDTGNPVLSCETPPSTCASCFFTIDTTCSSPPPDVQNFSATKAGAGLNNREVRLDWDALPACADFYDIERLNWVSGTGWVWQALQTIAHPTNTYIDTDARYSGSGDPIQYRIRARNVAGNSPDWATDTGYPILRNIKCYMWCWAQDIMGTGAATTWARGLADYYDADEFWNRYGLNLVSQNAGGFGYMTNPAYENLTGGEDWMMFNEYNMPNTLNVYYVVSWRGNFAAGLCYVQCPGSLHTLNNVFIILCRDTRGIPPNERPIVLAHEVGHGYARLFDVYLLDANGDGWKDTTCAIKNTWCTVAPNTPPLFCDDNACYSEPDDPPIPQNLMWMDPRVPVANFDITEPQWLWVDTWVHGFEANYPWP
jgi:hypothetical protein